MTSSVKEMFSLAGKVALITGGHTWLGFDMGCALAEAGCNIIIAARSQDKMDRASKEIHEKYGVDTLTIQVDVCSPEQVTDMAKVAFEWKGHIDVLINNAGGGSGASEGNFLTRDPKDVINLITTNLIGPMLVSQAICRFMAEQKSGKIINIGSIAGIVGRDRSMYRRNGVLEQPVDYAASKGGIIAMTRDLAAFMCPYNVQVNSISPGGFDKGALPEGFVKDYSSISMAGHMGTMGLDLKGAALFLSSPASNYVTGHNLVVDGGFSVYK